MRTRHYIFFGITAFLFLSTGISYVSRPNFEIAYDLQEPGVFCHEKKNCVVFYNVKLGNTGWKDQEQVVIEFANEALDSPAIPLKVQNFGKFKRQVKLVRGESSTRVLLGRVEPGKVMDISFALDSSTPDQTRPWSTLFRGIEPAQGETIQGSPECTTFSRFLFGFLGL